MERTRVRFPDPEAAYRVFDWLYTQTHRLARKHMERGEHADANVYAWLHGFASMQLRDLNLFLVNRADASGDA